MVQKSEYPIVLCIWEDIVATDNGWRDTSTAEEWGRTENTLVTQCGFLYKEEEKYILLVDSYFPGTTTVGAVTRIPRNNVVELKYL